ncbi:hypothetical protein ACN08Z_05895 [Rothia sp. P7181]|uniref:hypothetical protein n=1 Tax=Rothia sp. P7181 TaxID=3402663 RepID=UPI003ADDDE32
MSWINDKNPKVELINLFLDSDQPMDAALAWARNVAQRAGLDVKKDQSGSFARFVKQTPAWI